MDNTFIKKLIAIGLRSKIYYVSNSKTVYEVTDIKAEGNKIVIATPYFTEKLTLPGRRYVSKVRNWHWYINVLAEGDLLSRLHFSRSKVLDSNTSLHLRMLNKNKYISVINAKSMLIDTVEEITLDSLAQNDYAGNYLTVDYLEDDESHQEWSEELLNLFKTGYS